MKKLIPLLMSATLISATVACRQPNDKISNTSAPTSAQNQQAAIPAGTTFEATLQQELSTGKNKNNDRFTLRVKNSGIKGNKNFKDAEVQGHLENVVKAARGKKASLNLVFDDIQIKNAAAYPLDVTLVNTQIETKTKGKFLQNAGIILGGAVAGHFLGNKANMKHGALAGGGAATAFVLSSPGGEVVLKKGTDIKLKLQKALDTSS